MSVTPNGRHWPSEIEFSAWKRILGRTWHRLSEQNASVLAAGVAFYGVLAIFPALGSIVTVYALIADPGDVQVHFSALARVLPKEVEGVFSQQLASLAAREPSGLGLGVAFAIIAGTWSARRGADAVVRAITLAYREKESRALVARTARVFGITAVLILFVVLALLALIGVPVLLQILPLPDLAPVLISSVRWLIFIMGTSVLVAWLFRVAPPRRPARWRWVSSGSIVATVLWLAGSVGLSWYASSFGSFNETYGALGAVAVLLLWFQLTAFSLLLGATLNAEIEFEITLDTTIGPSRPAGERGAFVADNRPQGLSDQSKYS